MKGIPTGNDVMRAPENAKRIVREFYEHYGWERGGSGRYRDAELFVDGRRVAKSYGARARSREAAAFRRGGRYFLDAASGANPATDFAARFRRHVCVDFSGRALAEARRTLGTRGLYVLADVSALPFKDEAFDGLLSAHTLYHVHAEEQAAAVSEFLRVLCRRAPGAILYNTGELGALCRLRLVPTYWALRGWASRLCRRLRVTGLLRTKPSAISLDQAGNSRPPIYFHAYPAAWFSTRFGRRVETRCYQLLDQEHRAVLVPDNVVGWLLLWLVSGLERLFPHTLASWAGYIAIRLRKAPSSPDGRSR